MKECTVCGLVKPLEDYHTKNRKKKRKDGSVHCWVGQYAECKPCWLERNNKTLHKYKDYYKEYSKNYPKDKKKSSQLKYDYGITLEQYNQILVKQNGKCSICSAISPERAGSNYFHVDHCHITSEVRGLLCNNCNLGLGHFKDNTGVLLKAIDYLNNSKEALKGK